MNIRFIKLPIYSLNGYSTSSKRDSVNGIGPSVSTDRQMRQPFLYKRPGCVLAFPSFQFKQGSSNVNYDELSCYNLLHSIDTDLGSCHDNAANVNTWKRSVQS